MKWALAFLLMAPLWGANAFSAQSSFTRSFRSPMSMTFSSTSTRLATLSNGALWTMYDSPKDPGDVNAWSVLTQTEAWISSTLQSAASSPGGNPYTRKEVSYCCETNPDTPMIVAGIFRRLKELREAGQEHAQEQEELLQDDNTKHDDPKTMRQTQVIVIPGSSALSKNFPLFDAIIQRINQARRDARDYLTDIRLDSNQQNEPANDWGVSLNCAHMHPKYGELSPEQVLKQLKEEEEAGEVDLHLQEYKKKRLMARQSPYPTIVLEVRVLPPMDFGAAPPPPPKPTAAIPDEESVVTNEDVARLEALFGKSAFTSKGKDSFYDSIGDVLEEIDSRTPMEQAEAWVAKNDPAMDEPNLVASFTELTSPHVDAAYEFVFTNLAMLLASDVATEGTVSRQYMAMPQFLSAAATSFEKFSLEVDAILKMLPELSNKLVRIETFHPEHIDSKKRSPCPVFVLEWRQ